MYGFGGCVRVGLGQVLGPGAPGTLRPLVCCGWGWGVGIGVAIIFIAILILIALGVIF